MALTHISEEDPMTSFLFHQPSDSCSNGHWSIDAGFSTSVKYYFRQLHLLCN